VCRRQICILLLLIVLAGLLKSRMRSMDCKVVQFSTETAESHTGSHARVHLRFAFQTFEGVEGS